MIIKKGTHAPLRMPAILFDCVALRYEVEFTDSCRYNVGEDQGDINKLFGIGQFPHHHKNSVRYGWRWVEDMGQIEILAYWYAFGMRESRHIGWVNIGEKLIYQIDGSGPFWTLVFNWTTRLTIPLKPCRIGYLLLPYFGGNKTAPHDIEIKIKRV